VPPLEALNTDITAGSLQPASQPRLEPHVVACLRRDEIAALSRPAD